MPLPPLAAALELHAAVLLDRRPGALAGAKLRYIQTPPTRGDMKDANFEVGVEGVAGARWEGDKGRGTIAADARRHGRRGFRGASESQGPGDAGRGPGAGVAPRPGSASAQPSSPAHLPGLHAHLQPQPEPQPQPQPPPPTQPQLHHPPTQAGYHHYTRVKGIALPNTAALLAKWRPEALVLNWGMGTLTHFGPACVLGGSAKGAPAGECAA
jgi:hypothetical protein